MLFLGSGKIEEGFGVLVLYIFKCGMYFLEVLDKAKKFLRTLFDI
jgi:hypothetical protein